MSPLRGLRYFSQHYPWAYAHGYTLLPLRGWKPFFSNLYPANFGISGTGMSFSKRAIRSSVVSPSACA
jgi:hypothetical protein